MALQLGFRFEALDLEGRFSLAEEVRENQQVIGRAGVRQGWRLPTSSFARSKSASRLEPKTSQVVIAPLIQCVDRSSRSTAWSGMEGKGLDVLGIVEDGQVLHDVRE